MTGFNRPMQGYDGQGEPISGEDGAYHGGVHEYAQGVCEEGPACRPVAPGFTTKDSGERVEYPSGMRRDVQDGKARFDLIFPTGVAYEDQLLTRFAGLLERGAAKYGDNNWQKANSEEELDRFRASGLRHMIQWATGETDEDHATAVIFNLMAYEHCKRKIDGKD